jgi:DNA-binding MarR family transcriptional regulator
VAVPLDEEAKNNETHMQAAAPGSADLEPVFLENLLCHRVTVLSKLMNRLAGRYLAREFDLTIAEWWMLGQLDQHSPRTLRWLAEATFTDKAQMSRAAAALVERGYVTRQKDPADARSILFCISPQGKSVSDASGTERRDDDRKLLDLLSGEERGSLYASLDRLTTHLLNTAQTDSCGSASGSTTKLLR